MDDKRPITTRARILASLPLLSLLWSCGEATPLRPGPNPDSPFVAGFERFLRGSDDLLSGGRLLLGELGCVGCHTTTAGRLGDERKPAPRLSSVAEHIHPDQIRALIADPHGTMPGTTMPDLWRGIDAATRDAEVDALVHFLVAESPRPFQLEATDEAAAARGARTFDRVGCAACHEPADAVGEATPAGSVPLPEMANRYAVDGVTRFLLDPLAVRPGGRMPAFDLTGREARDLAHYLLAGTEVPAALRYVLWTGRFDDLDQLEQETPDATGVADTLDLTLAPQSQFYGPSRTPSLRHWASSHGFPWMET